MLSGTLSVIRFRHGCCCVYGIGYRLVRCSQKRYVYILIELSIKHIQFRNFAQIKPNVSIIIIILDILVCTCMCLLFPSLITICNNYDYLIIWLLTICIYSNVIVCYTRSFRFRLMLTFLISDILIFFISKFSVIGNVGLYCSYIQIYVKCLDLSINALLLAVDYCSNKGYFW